MYSVFLLLSVSSSLRVCFKGLLKLAWECLAEGPCDVGSGSGTSVLWKTVTISHLLGLYQAYRKSHFIPTASLQRRRYGVTISAGRTQRCKGLGECPEPRGWQRPGPDLCPVLLTPDSVPRTAPLSCRPCWEPLPYRFHLRLCWLNGCWPQGLMERAPLPNQPHWGCLHVSWPPDVACVIKPP